MSHGHLYTDPDGYMAVQPCTDPGCPMEWKADQMTPTPTPKTPGPIAPAELDKMPRTYGTCSRCKQRTMVYALDEFTCRKCATTPAVKAEDIKPGQVIKSGRRWYTVNTVLDAGREYAFDAQVTDSEGVKHWLGIWRGEYYPVKEA